MTWVQPPTDLYHSTLVLRALLPRLVLRSRHFLLLLYPIHNCLCSNPAEYKPHAHPLHASDLVSKKYYAGQHAQHLPRHSDRDKQKTAKVRKGVEYEDLTDCSTCAESEHVPSDRGVCGYECEGVGQFAVAGGGEADIRAE